MTNSSHDAPGKVPAVTFGFWVIKILATTLGETAGDSASMSLNLGYALSSALFLAIFIAAVIAQVLANSFRPWLYWFTIVATTTVGTTLADFADRSLGIGYAGGTSLLLALLLLSLLAWHRTEGGIAIDTISTPREETFYWVTIMFSQTLGTALGDWMADTNGLGYEGGALVFSAALLVVVAAYYRTRLSHTLLFWAAFILTRPLGATLGDLLDKPVEHGGLAFSRVTASALLAGLIALLIAVLPQRAGSHPGGRPVAARE